MTESEAINVLQLNTPFVASKEVKEALDMAIDSLKKVQKLEDNKTYHLYREYLSIGTVEELKELKEKQIAKKLVGLYKNTCPSCFGIVIRGLEFFCPKCGQKIDSEV